MRVFYPLYLPYYMKILAKALIANSYEVFVDIIFISQ